MKKKILLVDDDADALTIFGSILAGAGYEVIKASSGQEAIILAQEEQPQLIMLDIKMPGLDGVATTDRLKDSLSTRNIPIIYLSSLVRAEQVDRGHVPGSKIGDIHFIPKSASSEEILSMIAEKIAS